MGLAAFVTTSTLMVLWFGFGLKAYIKNVKEDEKNDRKN
jgi:hypothetical protein